MDLSDLSPFALTSDVMMGRICDGAVVLFALGALATVLSCSQTENTGRGRSGGEPSIDTKGLMGCSKEQIQERLGEPEDTGVITTPAPPKGSSEEEVRRFDEITPYFVWEYEKLRVVFNVHGHVIRVDEKDE